MSYFEFYNNNVNKPVESSKFSTIRQNVPPASGPDKPIESSERSQTVSSPRKLTNTSKATGIETLKTSELIKGTCLSMCPVDEVNMRVKAKMVHILEVDNGKRVLVKCYSRSAADSLVAVPRLLRPYKVLQDTVRYLLLQIPQREGTSAGVIYDFVSDRLRAVRQDMTVQRLTPTECVTLLEPMIRFHIYFGYKLCEYPINVYDPVLNKKLLLECLKWFLSCCDSMDQLSAGDLARQISQLNLTSNRKSGNTQSKGVINDRNDIKCDQVLMESLYILFNLDDLHPMYRYWNMSKNLKSIIAVKLAYDIAAANLRGNYVQVCKQLENLCPLTYCALCLHLPTLQRHALRVMSAAYNSKQLTVPLSAIRRWLRFDSDEEAARVCAHYGLVAKGGALRFSRGDFKTDVPTHQPTRPLLLDQKMNLSVKHVFTYISNDYAYAV